MSSINKLKLRFFISRFFKNWIKLYFLIKVSWTSSKRELNLILTPGKVGSSSVYYSLKKGGLQNVFHIHYLNKENIRAQVKLEKESDRRSIPLHLIVSQVLRREVDRFDFVNVICLSRNVIDREISAYFQNLHRDNRNFKENGEIDVNYVIKEINEGLVNAQRNLDSWFKREIEGLTNINLFEHYKKGIKVNEFRKTKFKLYFLRLEDLSDDSFADLTYKLRGSSSSSPLLRDNVGDEKFYKREYRYVKDYFNNLEIEVNSDYQKVFYG